MNEDGKINYIEFGSGDLQKTKAFFASVFDWQFTDYGSEYTAFSHAGIEGGFYQSEVQARSKQGSALIIFYSADLERTQAAVEQAGGEISRAVFPFPGGRRFHFIEPGGNELAVWSDRSV